MNNNNLIVNGDYGTISVYGLFIYRDFAAGISSMEAFLKAFSE